MPLHLGVLGCGRVFERFHLPAIDRTPGISLVAAADPDPRRLSWADARSPRPTVADSLDRLLGGARLNAALILTPPASHAELAVRALEAGLHVMVEKPMALTVSDGQWMTVAARRSGRRLQVGHTRRFREPYQALHARLREPSTPSVVAADFELAFPTADWDAHTAFLGDETLGGGPLDDVLSHQVDLLCWLLGREPGAARAEVRAGSARSAQAKLRFGELVARCRASHGPYVERLDVSLADGRFWEATGSRLRSTGTSRGGWNRGGAILMDRLALVTDKLRRRPNVTSRSFELQLRDFAQAVAGGPSTGATADEGLRVLRALEACRRSARDGGAWVALD